MLLIEIVLPLLGYLVAVVSEVAPCWGGLKRSPALTGTTDGE